MNRLLLRRSTAGFTLIEILVVVIMVGILASIAAPGWLGYMTNRRMGTARDQVLQALRQAQTEASRRKQDQVVVFNTTADPPTIQVLGSTQPLGQGEFKPGMVKLEARNGSVPVPQVRFDASGNLVEPATFADANGLKIVVSTRTDGSKRCIFIRTLLGAMQARNGNDCN